MSTTRYPIPAQRFRCETEEQRSRFITTIAPADTPEAAQEFIAAIKDEFPDANHNCWAYVCGPPGSSDRIGFSDDGEPHGVAGRPMLTALLHGGLGDTVVVVSRYFGGIKLGKGGMVKAYTAAVQAALEQLPRGEKVDWVKLAVNFDYSLVKPLELRLGDFEAERLDTSYAEQVQIILRLPREQLPPFRQAFMDLTVGRGELKEME